MKRRLGLFSTLVIATSLAGCTPRTDAPEAPAPVAETVDKLADIARYRALANEDYTLDAARDIDLGGLIAALPDGVSLSWDTQSFDADTGATVFTGLVITIAQPEPFGLRAERAAFWNFDPAFVADRLSGQRLDESGLVFDRMALDQVTYYGLADALRVFITGIVEDLGEEAEFNTDLFDIDNLDAAVGRWVMTDFRLRPWIYEPVDESVFDPIPDDELVDYFLPVTRIAQQAIAFQGALAYGDGVLVDSTSAFQFVQPGASISGTSSIEIYGFSGGSGWDLGRLAAQSVISEQVTTYTELPVDDGSFGAPFGSNPLVGKTITQTNETEYYAVENLRLDTFMTYLARGQFPDMDEKDLLGLGIWRAEGLQSSLDGAPVFGARAVQVDLDSWAWLIPTRISYELDDAVFNLANLSDFFITFFPPETVAEDEETATLMEGIRQAIDLLPEHGIDEITLDLTGHAAWSDTSGTARADMFVSSAGFGERYGDLDLNLPNYDALAAAKAADDPADAFENAFQTALAFKGLTLREADLGGYNKFFAYARDVGALYPDQGWGAMLANLEPQDMRMYIATMIRLGKAELSREIPMAADWIETIATYFEQSGELEIAVNPPEPITFELFQAIDEEATGPQPFVDALNITVVHTAN